MPLTSITAWETLFDRMEVHRPVPDAAPTILLLGGAGGVGSIAIQLLRPRTELTVIATASRPESAAWARGMGAHPVVDHYGDLVGQVASLGLGARLSLRAGKVRGSAHRSASRLDPARA